MKKLKRRRSKKKRQQHFCHHKTSKIHWLKNMCGMRDERRCYRIWTGFSLFHAHDYPFDCLCRALLVTALRRLPIHIVIHYYTINWTWFFSSFFSTLLFRSFHFRVFAASVECVRVLALFSVSPPQQICAAVASSLYYYYYFFLASF